ncbi:hypothetical protein L2E82_42874 [Cichorium intybus]|uniref:Uncharacterized protein n=1 Tax=Cichorium intybus TaxID=13427 RepID=A0ACB8ZMA5_CICIN|nr:hypothetical protein L2E82_42874 [Cichorium intybus]
MIRKKASENLVHRQWKTVNPESGEVDMESEIAMVMNGEDAMDAVKVVLGPHSSYGYRCVCRKFHLKEGSHGSWTRRLLRARNRRINMIRTQAGLTIVLPVKENQHDMDMRIP